MREILFKAKTVYNNEWICGSLVVDEWKSQHLSTHFITNRNKKTAVSARTACQFMGSYSIDNEMIYEWDKILFNNEEFTIIFFDGKFILAKNGKPHVYNPKFELCKVIGNIHD